MPNEENQISIRKVANIAYTLGSSAIQDITSFHALMGKEFVESDRYSHHPLIALGINLFGAKLPGLRFTNVTILDSQGLLDLVRKDEKSGKKIYKFNQEGENVVRALYQAYVVEKTGLPTYFLPEHSSQAPRLGPDPEVVRRAGPHDSVRKARPSQTQGPSPS